MSATPVSSNESHALVHEWIAQTPPQFLAVHALWKNLTRRLLDPSDQQALADVRRLGDLFAATRHLVDAMQGARAAVEQLRNTAVAAEPEIRKSMVTWASTQLSSLGSLGRTATQAEQLRGYVSQLQDMQREAALRLAALDLLARTAGMPAGESQHAKWRDLVIAGNLLQAVQDMEIALAAKPASAEPSKPAPSFTPVISPMPEAPPQPPPADPRPAEPRPAKPAPAPDLASATDDLYTLLHQCEVFAKALPELGGQLVAIRERERDLQTGNQPDPRQVRQLFENISKLLDGFRQAAEKEQASRLKKFRRLEDWTEKLFAERLNGTTSVEAMSSTPVRTARELLAFRKQANQFESELLAFASSEPGVLVSAVRERIEACRTGVHVVRGLPLREELERELREIEAEIPLQSDYAPVAAECLERCELCERLRERLENLTGVARREWEALLETLRSLNARGREARDFAEIVLSQEERASLPETTVVFADSQVPLTETTDRIRQLTASVEQLELQVEAAARDRSDALLKECAQFFERIPSHSQMLPQAPAAGRSWSEWNNSLAEAEKLRGALEDQFVTEARNLDATAKNARVRLHKLVSSPRWQYSPELRGATDLLHRLEKLAPLTGPTDFAGFDARAEEVDLAETLLLRLEGAEYYVRDEAGKLERRLAALVDGGITYNRSTLIGRATALVEGLSLAVQEGDAHWHQLTWQCKVIDQLLGALEIDQVQLAGGWMEARAAELERLLEQTPSRPMRDRLVNLRNDVQRAAEEGASSRALRRRLLAALGSRAGEDGA